MAGQDSLDHPSGGVPIARTGRQGQNAVVHSRDNTSIDDRTGQGKIDQGLLISGFCELQAIGEAADACLVGGKDRILAGSGAISQLDDRMLVPIGRIIEIFQAAEHGSVSHTMAVNDCIEIT